MVPEEAGKLPERIRIAMACINRNFDRAELSRNTSMVQSARDRHPVDRRVTPSLEKHSKPPHGERGWDKRPSALSQCKSRAASSRDQGLWRYLALCIEHSIGPWTERWPPPTHTHTHANPPPLQRADCQRGPEAVSRAPKNSARCTHQKYPVGIVPVDAGNVLPAKVVVSQCFVTAGVVHYFSVRAVKMKRQSMILGSGPFLVVSTSQRHMIATVSDTWHSLTDSRAKLPQKFVDKCWRGAGREGLRSTQPTRPLCCSSAWCGEGLGSKLEQGSPEPGIYTTQGWTS